MSNEIHEAPMSERWAELQHQLGQEESARARSIGRRLLLIGAGVILLDALLMWGVGPKLLLLGATCAVLGLLIHVNNMLEDTHD